VWQRLRDEHGLTVSVTSFRRYVWLEFGDEVSADDATVLRPDVAPGSEAQIDYGYLGSWFDPVAARARKVWAFVMVLACSRHMFVRPVFSMDQRSWTASHVAAFEFFGGVPERLVPDNLKTGVAKPDLYDPKINRAYADLGAHYGCLIDPARALKPKDKPRVERPMPYVRDSFWRGREWASLDEMQSAAVTWCSSVAGTRRHRSLDGAQPAVVFAAVEADALIGLPVEVFELAAWSRPKVHPDCHVKVGRALYSVPWRLIGTQVDARESDRTVEVFVDGKVVKTWARIERGRQTDYDDYPPEKVAFFMRNPTWCRQQAAGIGPAAVEVINGLFEINALHRLRSAQGIISLADNTASNGSRPPAGGPSMSATPPTRRSRGSSPPGPRPPPMKRPGPRHRRRTSTAPPASSPSTGRSRRDPPPPTRDDAADPEALRDARHPRSPPDPSPRR